MAGEAALRHGPCHLRDAFRFRKSCNLDSLHHQGGASSYASTMVVEIDCSAGIAPGLRDALRPLGTSLPIWWTRPHWSVPATTAFGRVVPHSSTCRADGSAPGAFPARHDKGEDRRQNEQHNRGTERVTDENRQNLLYIAV